MRAERPPVRFVRAHVNRPGVVVVLITCVFCLAASAPRVVEIRIEAPRAAEQGRIRAALPFREGDTYTDHLAAQAIRKLWELPAVGEVRIRTEDVEGGVRVIIEVQPASDRVVRKIQFAGRTRISAATLHRELEVLEGDLADPFQLEGDTRRLRTLLKDKGYRYATVQRMEQEIPDGVEVTYLVDAGTRLRIETIEFEGNAAFSSRGLSKAMATKPDRWHRRAEHDPQIFNADLDAIREYYYIRGWEDAVTGKREIFDDEKERVYLIVRVNEGERYRVRRVQVEGNTIFSEAEIKEKLSLEDDRLFSRLMLSDDQQIIRGMYGEQGYRHARIALQVKYAESGPWVESVTFRISEGERIYIGAIKIRGNWRTRDNVIRRELTFHPGERIDTSKIEDSKWNLLNTGFFVSTKERPMKEAVSIRYEPTEEPNTENVIVEVEEGMLGSFSVGGGLSSEFGFFGDIGLEHGNFDPTDFPTSIADLLSGTAFAGRGQRLALRLSPGTFRDSYQLSWTNPSVYDGPYSTGLNLFFTEWFFEDWDERRAGGNFTVGRRIWKALSISFTPGIQWIKVKDLDDDAPADAVAVEGRHERRSLKLSLGYDRRDNRFFPTSGYSISGSVMNAGSFLGGDVDVLRNELEGRYYKTIWDQPGWGKHVLAIGGMVGLQEETSGGDTPIFERFFAGGLGTLRGFEYRGVGPADPVFEKIVGGDLIVLGNIEYSIPLVRDVIRWTLFADFGKVDEDIGDFNARDLRLGVGTSIQFQIPGSNIPLNLGVGFPIARERTDDTEVFHFSMGTWFGF